MLAPPFNTYLGVRIDRMEEGEALVQLSLGPHHLNNRGVAHGGVYTSVLDTAMGAAVISAIPEEWWCATVSLSVQFLDGARAGTLSARGRVLRKGRRVAFVGGELHDETGRLLATAQGSWHLWPSKPEASGAEVPGGYVVVRGTGERLRVGKIVAVGRNYADHVKEMGNAPAAAPVLFLKPPTALVADGGTVRIPRGAGQVHHEVELVVVIGKDGKEIGEERALDHVLGYAVGLDMTLRDLQAEAKKAGEPWDVAKGFDTSAPVSLVAPRAEAGDPAELVLALAVNGKTRQSASTSSMLHGVPALIAHVSRFFRLERGDLLFTGTPAGVGPVVPGDRLEARLGEIATLRVMIAADDGP